MHSAPAATRMPVLFIPHGGGPCFFMEWNPPDLWTPMAEYLKRIVATLPRRPRAILLISAHWEERHFTVGSAPAPELIFDYYGFPAHTYELTWPAPGAPDLAHRAQHLLAAAGLPTGDDPRRGYDHGVFIPLKLVVPDADIPIATLSLRSDHEPDAHLAAGRALAPLRDESVLIVGSGMSFHNMRAFRDPAARPAIMAEAPGFDGWLTAAVTTHRGEARDALLAAWPGAPGAPIAHPPGNDEHLLPLLVAAGAAGDDRGCRDFHEARLGVSGYSFAATA